jgi:SAM-dependent methyltransferase
MSASVLDATLCSPSLGKAGPEGASARSGLAERLHGWLTEKSRTLLAARERALLTARQPAAELGQVLCFDRRRGTAAARLERLRGQPSGSADAIVSLGALADADDVEVVLAEMKRVLRPEGRLLFVEPVAARPGSRLRRAQRALGGLWTLLAGGDTTAPRDLWNDLKVARFGRLTFDRVNLPGLGGLPVPHIVGDAIVSASAAPTPAAVTATTAAVRGREPARQLSTLAAAPAMTWREPAFAFFG